MNLINIQTYNTQEFLFGCIFIGITFIILLIKVYSYIYGEPIGKISRRTREEIHPLLTRLSPYYNNLIDEEKDRFGQRVIHFVKCKEFSALKGFDLDEEMKVAIAATATQITFGYNDYDDYDYAAFNKIIVLPKDYVSKTTHEIYKGETGRNDDSNYVAISWESFKKESSNPHDGLNVGLHEFAHALYVNNIEGNTNDEFINSIGIWYNTVTDVAKKETTHQFFRNYAFVNRMEFFAVTMEYFFEEPQEFNAHVPKLYQLMTVILNQNPMIYNNGIERS